MQSTPTRRRATRPERPAAVGQAPPAFPLHEPLQPVRAELYGAERLEAHAANLAAAQRIATDETTRRRLAPRVRENGRVLLDVCRKLAAAERQEGGVTPAAEWLVDNFHVVDEQLREIEDDLPPGFYRVLPKLGAGEFTGYPRVYEIAWEYVAHTDSRFDPEVLERYVRAYQRVLPLTIGELWALPVTLRVVLVENLRRLAESIVRAREVRREADRLADRLLGLSGEPVASPQSILGRFDGVPLPAAFMVQLVQRLRDQDAAAPPALSWLHERLSAERKNAEEIVRGEHQWQAATNVTVRNVITSMRLVSASDWNEFFESVSLVDEILGGRSVFTAMDFATRDRYRHAVEEIARGSGRTEHDVARRAVALSSAVRGGSGDAGDARADPGYYLIGKGRILLERDSGFRPSFSLRLARAFVAGGLPAYVGSLAVGASIVLALALSAAARPDAGPLALVLLAFFGALPALELATVLVHRAITELIGPRLLPRLELVDGVPAGLRTMVVMPTFLASESGARDEIDRLEVHYLANPDGDVRFALLSDWPDAPGESAPGDDEALASAVESIARLNERHGEAPGGGDRFLLLHRRRLFNEREGKWIGWERKRGKLHELNRLLRGAADTSFVPTLGRPPAVPPGVRYVITLDADTRLPRGAVNRLVGTMSHPLNRAIFDAEAGRVVAGYGILQPRVTPTLPLEGEGSLFQRLVSGPAGIDPYAGAVSDVYQDLFGEGSYTGKGSTTSTRSRRLSRAECPRTRS